MFLTYSRSSFTSIIRFYVFTLLNLCIFTVNLESFRTNNVTDQSEDDGQLQLLHIIEFQSQLGELFCF